MAAHVLDREEQFKEWLEKAGDKLVVVDFWAAWCGPCRVIGPVFDGGKIPGGSHGKELSADKELQKSVIFLKVDVDTLSDLAEEVGIDCMPTFMFFKKGQKVACMAGANTELLREYVHKHK